MLKINKRCTWNEIKIGEVFAWSGCWEIWYKLDEKRVMKLAEDTHTIYSLNEGNIVLVKNCIGGGFYKIPQSVQRLWKEE